MGTQARADQALAAQRQFDQLVASIDGIVWEGDPETFQFTFVSQQAERLLGYPVAAWLEPGFWSTHLYPDDRERTIRSCTTATRELRSHDLEYRMLAADGRAVWLRDIVSVAVEGDRPVKLRGVMVDISRAKETEAALRESEQLHRLLIESSHDLITLFDLDGRCVYASPSYHRLAGDAPATRLERVHPDDLGAVRAAWEATVRGADSRVVFRALDAAGGWLWLDARSALVRHHGRPHVLSIKRDITEERRGHEDRRAHLWFFESLDRVNRAIQGTDDLARMLEDVLDAVLAIFGCDRAWVVYPCDPESPTWRVCMERTRPEYPGALASFGPRDFPIDPAIVTTFATALAAAGPARFGPHERHPVSPDLAARFSIQSMLVMTLRPKLDRPYLFGLHQCSYQRSWTPDEERLFQEIGRRIGDALTGLLVLRDLRASEGKLADAERLAHMGYWEVALDADRVSWSEETYRIFGVAPEERGFGLARVEALVHPEDREAWRSGLAAALAGKNRYEREYRVLRPDGEIRVVHSQGDVARDPSGHPLSMFGTLQDVTERRRAEEALLLFRSLLDHANDAIEVIDPLTGRFLDVNQTASGALGYSAEECRRLRVSDVDLVVAERPWRETARELRGAGSRVFETRRRRKDGSLYTAEVNATYAKLDRDYVLAVVRDITERKRAEDALRASERELRATFDLSAVGQAQADPESGRLVRVNRKLCDSLGYSEEELLALDLAALTHPDDRARDLVELRRLAAGEIAEYTTEKRMIRKDGGGVWFRVSASVIRDASGRPRRAVAICEDITEHKRAEDALRVSEARFRTFVDHATDAFFLHAADGIILDVNQQACESLGYTREELIGAHPAMIDADSDAERMAAIGRRLAAGETLSLDVNHRRKDGTVFPVELRVRSFWQEGRRFGISLARDVTERKRAERALVESHALLRAVIEGTSDAVFVKDLEGRYEMINSAGARYLGRKVDEVIGKLDSELFLAEGAREIVERDREVMASGRSLTGEETASAAGVTRTYLSTKSARRDAHGQVTGLIGIARDFTELKRLEEQLRQAQKMEAVGRLAGGIAHDFNNLLTIVNVNSAFVLRDLAPEDPKRELLVDIQGAGKRAANLTRQLLAFSRRQVLKPQVVNVNAVLSELLKMLARLIGEDIEIDLAAGGGTALARIDPGQFEQAIINLAVNARDAMPGGGRLTIVTRDVELDADHAARYPEVAPGRYVCVSVSDTGHGMDAETRARVFDPFFTTKPPGKGTGLGLAMVYGFVKQSEGHVDVDSAPGAGTTFNLYLPRAEALPGAVLAPGAPAAVAGGKETILVVEDDAAVRRLVVRVLRGGGYHVLEASDGEEALAVARSHTAPIHLVVTDLVMPRSSGRELADALARHRPAVRVLFMSGYTDEAMLRHGIDEPAVAFLHKPFTAEALAEKVRKVLDAA